MHSVGSDLLFNGYYAKFLSAGEFPVDFLAGSFWSVRLVHYLAVWLSALRWRLMSSNAVFQDEMKLAL
jgi:hypothetical protein